MSQTARTEPQGSVLIVEDEQDNAELLRRIFRADARLWVAPTIAEARAILGKVPINVVVTDHRLPDGAGTELLEFLASNHPTIGRVLVTAYGDTAAVVEACRRGTVQRFFLKPYPPSQLRGAVAELLRLQGVTERPRVLLADDDVEVRDVAKTFLAANAVEVIEASDGEEARRLIAASRFDAAVIDVRMPKLDGVGVLQWVLAKDPHLPVIILTGGDPMMPLSLLRAGAFDVVSKPVRREELVLRVERAIMARRVADEHQQLLQVVEGGRQRQVVVAESEAMKAVVAKIAAVARHDVTVLITGETGTGKEVVARLLHRESRVADGPFIPVNCGAIPETLIESELFGYEKGAFTGATGSKRGFFEAADGGTIFLDEIGELSPHAQVHLLRVLELKEVTRVGATRPVQVNVRVVAATHRDLRPKVQGGGFREDLFYRIGAFAVHIPPLRQRPEDIAPLIQLAASSFCARNGLPAPALSTTALAQARRHAWPGNVRELLHAVERTLITRGPAQIDALELEDSGPRREAEPLPIDDSLPMRQALDPILEDLERRYLLRVLAKNGGHLGRSAEQAGLHRKSLYNKLKRYGISVDDALLDDDAPVKAG